MRHYLIIVEGAHDIAVIERLLILNHVEQRVRTGADLPDVWKHTLPSTFPFQDGKLDRITPIPSFLKNSELSVAIKNAGSDTQVVSVLQQLLDTMLVSEKDQLSGIMLCFDADTENAASKMKKLLSLYYEEKNDFKITQSDSDITLNLQIKTLPVHTFVFPDNENPGNLENLLLETAQSAYPELLSLAKEYISSASEIQRGLKKEQNANKAIIGCIANVMKPGKANQVSVSDDDWISDETLEVCLKLQKLNAVLRKMISA